MAAQLTDVERLQVERACERLVLHYSRLLDLGDMEAAANCFARDATFARPMMPDQLFRGREAIRASLLTRPKSLLTKHLATNIMIDAEGPDSASGLSYLMMVSTTPAADAKPPHVSQGPLWFGEMRDRFVREDGEWKFLERRGSIQLKYGGPPAP
jgi:ketosteroid isomerase-like protein